MKKQLIITAMLFVLLMGSAAVAGPLADEKLLEFLKANGSLTEEQVREIKCILYQEQKKEAVEQTKKEAEAVKVKFDDGLRIEKGDKSFSARIGGLLQTDFLMFEEHYPVDNDFDIRRARVFLEGRVYRDFQYRLEFELEGGSSNRLIDAYVNYDYFPWMQIQLGQFKEPFSLEQLISDKNLPLNERSMAWYLTPDRDVGFMVHGTLLDESVVYGVGIFNGDGRDADRRSQKDDKQVTGRLAIRPFSYFGPGFLKTLQIGGSYSYSRLDTSDFKFNVKTPARTTFFTLQSRAKFYLIEDIDDLNRWGGELAYTIGPVVFMGEYIQNKFKSVQIAETDRFDFSMRAWYGQMLIMLTGERPVFKDGVLEKIRPIKNFNIRTGTWGAWGLAFMYQDFEADKAVYDFLVQEGDSIRRANSFTAGLNWYLNSMVRLTLNYSRTRFDDRLFLGSHPTKGYSYYQDIEHAWVTRFQLEF